MSYRIARRQFLAGAGVGLAGMLRSLEAGADGTRPPLRLLVVHRPNGTIPSEYLPNGAAPGAAPGSILQAFDAVKNYRVVVDGLTVMPRGGEGTHEAGIVTLYTGHPIGPTRPTNGPQDDWLNLAPSVDQVFLSRSAVLKAAPIKSVQLGAHNDQGVPEQADRVLSYTGPDQMLFPEIRPQAAFNQVFGSLVAGGDPVQLARARAKKKSVLDFVRADLRQLRELAPGSERARLDAHEASIRELEQRLDAPVRACLAPSAGWHNTNTTLDFNVVGEVGRQMFAIIRAAFECDLTRVVTFLWSPGVSDLAFEALYPGMERNGHHNLSHMDLNDPGVQRQLAAIDRWYASQTAVLFEGLAKTSNGRGGVLLDDTLALFASEVGAGDHRFTNIPLALFGGRNTRLGPGRIVSYPGRSTNDLWLSMAPVFGVDLPSLGQPGQYQGPLPGLFQ